jgi:hypothetical protein
MEVIVQTAVFWGLTPCILLVYINILEKHAASIFRVEVCRVSSW